jgi:hypothetical protein
MFGVLRVRSTGSRKSGELARRVGASSVWGRAARSDRLSTRDGAGGQAPGQAGWGAPFQIGGA